MPSKPSTVLILCWSLAEEPKLVQSLRNRYERVLCCPLQIDAWRAACRLFQSDEIIDVGDLAPPGERHALFAWSLEASNRLWWRLQPPREAPWMACMVGYETERFLYYLRYWKALIEKVDAQWSEPDIVYYGPFSTLSTSGPYQYGAWLLQCLLEDRVGQDAQPSVARPWRRRMGARMGRLAQALAGMLSEDEPVGWLKDEPAVEAALFGLTNADRVFQREIARRLTVSDKGGRVLWVRADEEERSLTQDERAYGAASPETMPPHRCLRFRGASRWRLSFLRACSKQADGERLERALRDVIGPEWPASVVRRLSSMMLGLYDGDGCLAYHRALRVLRHVRPSRVVGSSVYSDMGYVRAAARKRGIPFYRIPHSAEFTYDHAFAWDAEAIAAMGEDGVRELRKTEWGAKTKMRSVGGVHVADQALKAFPAAAEGRSVTQLCYLVSGTRIVNVPDSYGEILRDIRSAAQACAARGMALGLRCHPRMSGAHIYERVIQNCRDGAIPVERLSTEESIHAQLGASFAAIVKDWGGAGVMALYSGRPVLGWMPRPGYPQSDRIIVRLPLVFRDAEELGALIDRLRTDEAFHAETLRKQKALLEDLVTDPWGDPYARVVEMIGEGVLGS